MVSPNKSGSCIVNDDGLFMRAAVLEIRRDTICTKGVVVVLGLDLGSGDTPLHHT
jgi:hypothetical protein